MLYIFIFFLIICVGSFLIKRYTNNRIQTSNEYYSKLNLTNTNNKPVIYLFWNGDENSTYLLIDLLLQDYPIRPLYIEQYTIIKKLELQNANNIANLNLKNIARLKKKQDNEMKQIELYRKIIINQYPEFEHNFLPPYYITSIAKDLELTSQFSNTLKKIAPIHYDDIEFLEQVIRFTKHFNKPNSRILIGYSINSKNIKLIQKILTHIDTNLELPLQNTSNKNFFFNKN